MTDAASARQTLQLPPDLARALDAALAEWQRDGRMARLWARDAALWTGADEARWMGWLDAPGAVAAEAAALASFGAEVREHGFADALLLGMGGSSLCPEVFAETFEPGAGAPRLRVLDSTDPAQVARVERRLDADRTLFIVASKSGSTLEPNVFHAYFFERLASRLGRARAAARFVAITDPGSSLERLAASEGFLRTFAGVPSIGGRFSALSNFGMVPAAVMGLDVAGLAARAAAMARACAAGRPVADNPGARLGLALGLAARAGRDKVTLIASPAISDLGAWLEQLIAESTGKQGKALIPVAGERTGPPEVYGDDRVFVYLRLAETADAGDDARVDALARAGHPVVRLALADRRDLAAEFFRWEIATAVAGAVLGINPFDQPDVEASKVATRRLTDAYEETGELPAESPIVDEGGVKLFTDEANARDLLARGRVTRRRRRDPRAPRAPRRRRLLRAARLRGPERVPRGRARDHAPPRARPRARRDLPRLRAALPALDRTGLQGRPQLGRVPAGHVRRRGRPAGPGPALHLRRGQGRAGAGRLRGARRARPPRPARPPRARRDAGAGDVEEDDGGLRLGA